MDVHAYMRAQLLALEEVRDAAYVLPAPACVAWFEMRRHATGWRTVAYSEDAQATRVECPLALVDAELDEDVPGALSSLRAIRRHYERRPLVYARVVRGHLTAPETLYQLVVCGLTSEARDTMARFFAAQAGGLTHDYEPRFAWLSEVPSVDYKRWLST